MLHVFGPVDILVLRHGSDLLHGLVLVDRVHLGARDGTIAVTALSLRCACQCEARCTEECRAE